MSFSWYSALGQTVEGVLEMYILVAAAGLGILGVLVGGFLVSGVLTRVLAPRFEKTADIIARALIAVSICWFFGSIFLIADQSTSLHYLQIPISILEVVVCIVFFILGCVVGAVTLIGISRFIWTVQYCLYVHRNANLIQNTGSPK